MKLAARPGTGWRRAAVAASLFAALAVSSAGCRPQHGRAAVSLKMDRTETTPRDAAVIIDEQYVGPLYYVVARGVRLPVGEHRITVQKDGYFPWDELVVADRPPIYLKVELTPIPD